MEHKLSIDTNFVTIGHIEAEILWPTLYYSLYPEQYIPHIPDISVGLILVICSTADNNCKTSTPKNVSALESVCVL